jgi:hypothetical protein
MLGMHRTDHRLQPLAHQCALLLAAHRGARLTPVAADRLQHVTVCLERELLQARLRGAEPVPLALAELPALFA